MEHTTHEILRLITLSGQLDYSDLVEVELSHAERFGRSLRACAI